MAALTSDAQAAEKVEDLVLSTLDGTDKLNTGSFAAEHSIDHNELCRVILSLRSDAFVETKMVKVKSYTLTKEGDECVASGSPEYKLYQALKAAGGKLAIKDVPKSVPKVATGKAMQRKW